MSTLRKFQTDPSRLLNNALSMYRSKQIITAVVEGVCDKRFLNQWVKTGSAIRFDGFDGKELVDLAYQKSQQKPYSSYDFLCFFADVDFDVITKKPLNEHPNFVYNAFCFNENVLLFNDLESYLINTKAFEKILVNLDLDTIEADLLRERLERASRVTGSLRAADIIIQRTNNLKLSVLNGLEIRGFFNASDISFNGDELFKALPHWSNYRERTSDLIEIAQRLDRESPKAWSLSRGHDLTEMLALHLDSRGKRGMTPEKIEQMLRLGCEFSEFKESPMGKQFTSAPVIGARIHSNMG